ncbi:MAG: Fe-S cluster assembly protein SufD [Chitinophagaceae bacterium]|nr:Fe-S cluster assembly protein SufD [Chitinophagaceae bacterium]
MEIYPHQLLFNKDTQWNLDGGSVVGVADIERYRLPGHEKANELVFVNGRFDLNLSKFISPGLQVLALENASEHSELIEKHFGHSAEYLKDGMHALNTALMQGGAFVYVPAGVELAHPVYVYHVTDARAHDALALPRSLVFVGKNAQLQWVENFVTLGSGSSLTNQVTEVVVDTDARFYHYKLQQDSKEASLVSSTHIRQIGKSFAYAVTISLDGHIVRNNTHMVMEAEYCESHMYGIYLLQGKTHVDNHTIVDNVKPNCYSNELYKGVIGDEATGVFNGKIFVRQDAQKTNAYQSNKNILLSEGASMNTKPQLEIFADDVKCSHGCTIGRLDEEGLFYLQSRGIPEKQAKSLLLHGFTSDILEKIQLDPIREYAEESIHRRLEML